MDMNLYEKTISEEVIYEGNITKYVVQEVELPDGRISKREIVRHAPAVNILPLIDRGTAIFVKQYRKAIDKVVYELPAGLIDPEDDSPLAAAKRELSEETGLKANEWIKLTEFYSSAGFTDEKAHIYIAKDLQTDEDYKDLDSTEFLEVVELSKDEAWDLYEQGEISGGKSVFCLFYWMDNSSII